MQPSLPFHFPERQARIRAALRRHRPAQQVLTAGPVTLNAVTHEVWRDGEPVELTRREFDLLYLLMQHPNQILSRQTILDRVWGYDCFGDTNLPLEYHEQSDDGRTLSKG